MFKMIQAVVTFCISRLEKSVQHRTENTSSWTASTERRMEQTRRHNSADTGSRSPWQPSLQHHAASASARIWRRQPETKSSRPYESARDARGRWPLGKPKATQQQKTRLAMAYRKEKYNPAEAVVRTPSCPGRSAFCGLAVVPPHRVAVRLWRKITAPMQ